MHQPPDSASSRFLAPSLRTCLALLGAGLLAAGGCSVVQHESTSVGTMVKTLTGKEGHDPAQQMRLLQMMVMREADQYTAVVAQGTDDFQSKVDTTEARIMALRWKLHQATGAYIAAAGEVPTQNAVDMVVLATVSRMVVQDYWVGDKFGAAAQPLLDSHRQLETNAWVIANQALTPQQQGQLREVIRQWRAENPHERNVASARFSDLVKILQGKTTSQSGQGPASLLSLSLVNPLSGLDPAVQAVEQTRQLAARAMYYAERAPRLLSWQVELLTYQLAGQPASQRVLTDVDRISEATLSFSKTAQGLPDLIKEEREAAINQLLAGVANERSNILATLNSQETQLKELLPQVRETLTAGGDMARSVNAAIQSLDTFVRYVSPPDTNTVPVPPDTNSPPFNVLDYGKAATQIGGMASNLTAMIQAVNQSEAQVARLSKQATTDAREVVNHAFRLGLVLVAAIGVVAWLVGAAGRRAARKQTGQSPPPAS